MKNKTIKANGCLVWRPARQESQKITIEVLVVHRDRYDDWSFPKGKLDPGETDLECALREVHEETGFTGTVGNELPATHYIDHKGRDKVVRYWMLEQTGGEFVENEEVDEARWLSPDEAAEILSYQHDIDLLASL